MIAVKCSIDNFLYDVHSLVKAFYPGEDVKVFVDGEKDLISDNGPQIEVIYNENNSEIRILELEDADTTESSGEQPKVKEVLHLISDEESYDNRAEYKNCLKQVIYKALSKYLNKELPWGTLTGIRPTKIAVSLLEDGKRDEEVAKHYKEVYLASKEKTNLAIEIAHRELGILSKINSKDGYSLYIGIPFCPTTCLYCSFTSFPRALYAKQIDEYIGCLKKEIDYVVNMLKDEASILDAGTAIGSYPKYLTEKINKNFKVLGVDGAEKMLEIARKNAPKAEFKLIDLREMNFNPKSFDCIIVMGKMSDNELMQYKYMAVSAVTLATRYAIQGGLNENKAYEFSDRVVKTIDKLTNKNEIFNCLGIEIVKLTQDVKKNKKHPEFSPHIRNCIKYINENLSEKIKVSDVAKSCGISADYLSQIFKREIGENLSSYIVRQKLEKAKSLLLSGMHSKEICIELSFSSQAYFITAFKRFYNITPSEYIKITKSNT